MLVNLNKSNNNHSKQQQDDSAYVYVTNGSYGGDRDGPEDTQEPNKGCAEDTECFGRGEGFDRVFPNLKFVSFESSLQQSLSEGQTHNIVWVWS